MRILFVGVDWLTKQIITQTLFEDSEEENELTIIGQDTPEFFWNEFPMLKEYLGDERVDYRQESLDKIDDLLYDAIYITDTEPELLDPYLDAARRYDFKGPIILASSWQVYGWKKKKKTPILETERDLNPETNTAKHLLELEEIMLKHGQGKKLQTVILRYGEVFGKYMPESSELVKMMIDCLSSEEIDVYPPQSRCYDWIDAKYIYELVPKLFARKFIGGGEVYNIGSGEEKKMTWLANSLRHLTNSPAPIKLITPENPELFEARGYHSVMDCNKAKSFLQYEPEGIRINQFLSVARWIEYHLPEGRRAPDLEETFPQLRPDWGTNAIKVQDDKGDEVEIPKI